jgi:hypothetical protein
MWSPAKSEQPAKQPLHKLESLHNTAHGALQSCDSIVSMLSTRRTSC